MAKTTSSTLEEQFKKIQEQTLKIFKTTQEEGITADGKVLLEAGALRDVPGLAIDLTGVPDATKNSLDNIIIQGTSALAGATSQDEFFKAQQDLLKKQQEALAKTQTEQQDWITKFKDVFAGRRPTADIMKEQMKKFGIPETWDKVQALIPEIGALSSELATLQTREMAEVSGIEHNPQYSVQFASRESARVSREYAIKQAGVSAELGAKTALMEAYRGNITTARNLVADVVGAMTYDTDQKLQDINTFIDNNQTFINGLRQDQKDLLNDIQSYWNTKAKDDKQDYRDKLNLIVTAANAGVNLGIGVNDVQKMSLDEVTKLYQEKVGAKPKEEAPVTREVGGVLYQWDKTSKSWQPAKGIPGAPEMSVDYWVKAIQGGIADISNIPSDIRSQVVEQIFAPREYPENELQIMIRNMRAGTATQPELDYQGALDAIAMDETILNKDMANYLTALEYGEIEPETTFEAFTGTEKPKKTAAELEREAREAGKLGYISPEGEFISLPESISPLVE
ncbi:MAG TPA: hypothetical protein ENH85_01285 [Candidatus Scalindua sp.]|nr:hypothetical protein [Candidatus Scalindua sp.]